MYIKLLFIAKNVNKNINQKNKNILSKNYLFFFDKTRQLIAKND